MMNYLFSARGRLSRAQFWKSILVFLAGIVVVALIVVVLWQIIPGEQTADGTYSVSGVKAIPYLVVVFGYLILMTWAAVCIGIKRYHDRNKPGVWVLIQFVPFIGAVWYFVEAGCLAGTPGPNLYGPDPVR